MQFGSFSKIPCSHFCTEWVQKLMYPNFSASTSSTTPQQTQNNCSIPDCDSSSFNYSWCNLQVFQKFPAHIFAQNGFKNSCSPTFLLQRLPKHPHRPKTTAAFLIATHPHVIIPGAICPFFKNSARRLWIIARISAETVEFYKQFTGDK